MSSCPCGAAGNPFDAAKARRDLNRFRRRGPERATAQLVGAIEAAGPSAGRTLLDIGGGIGAIHHALLGAGYSRAVHLDASPAYLAVAAEESERLGHSGRVEFRHGDFHSAAPSIARVDVVTLDRVVCCDEDYAGLLRAAADRAGRLLALTYPRDRWPIRGFIALMNGARTLVRRPFTVYVHPPAAMARVLEERGLRRRWRGGTFIWSAELYERAS
ncbi:MAG: class I SAM-dependent methyltransferase [Acidobacteria bacterium]|nr:class I SAM-dependent methyltransferase [Acidobacteriota bacterium]